MSCPNNCSNHGICQSDNTCLCNNDWEGKDCSIRKCINDCSGHGTCDQIKGNCKCDTGYSGIDCSVHKSCIDDCNNRGICDYDDCDKYHCKCKCSPPYIGPGCSVVDRSGNVQYVHIFLYIIAGIFGLAAITLGVYLLLKWYKR